MTHYSYLFEPFDFRPAEAGWTVWTAWLDEGEFHLDCDPLAGWMILRQTKYDTRTLQTTERTDERRVVPAVWSQQDGELQTLDDLDGVGNLVAYVVGPGQDVPAEEDMREAVRRKIGRRLEAEWQAEA